MKARLILLLSLVILLITGAGCRQHTATVPVAQTWETSTDPAEILIVFLPGIRDNKEDFVEKGMFSRLQQSALNIDMVSVDLNVAYLQSGTMIERLQEDIIEPAHRQGYKKIWLAGISLGGLNSLLYMKSHPEDVCGIILLSPFLGDKKVRKEILSAGGIDHWQGTKDEGTTLWRWLKTARLQNVYLGSGQDDRFLPLQQQLASLLPENNVLFINGGHRWPVWQDLWENFVSRMVPGSFIEHC